MDTVCLETRRALTAEPNNRDSELLQHLSSCKSCAQYSQKLRTFDDKLKMACNMDIPEGLESRIILAQRMASGSSAPQENVIPINKTKSTTSYRWMSMAAALVLAVGLSFGMFKWGESQTVQGEVLAHIGSHLYELEVDENVQLASLNKFLKNHGLLAKEGIGYVRHVSNCPIEGKMVPHLVVGDDRESAVTVMYIPWKDSAKRTPFKNDRFKGVLVGAQKGSFAIVSDDADKLQSAERRVMNSMEIKI